MSTLLLERPAAATPPSPPQRVTEAEYFARDNAAQQRSEWIDAKMIAVPGGTEEHGTLIVNIGTALKVNTRGKGARIVSDQRVRATNLYYPDIVVTRGTRLYDAIDPTTPVNPTVLVEVLSDSTEKVDRGTKLRNYCGIASLRTYLLVSQYQALIEQFERDAEGRWNYSVVSGLKAVIDLPALDCPIILAEIYDDMDIFEEDESVQDDPSSGAALAKKNGEQA